MVEEVEAERLATPEPTDKDSNLDYEERIRHERRRRRCPIVTIENYLNNREDEGEGKEDEGTTRKQRCASTGLSLYSLWFLSIHFAWTKFTRYSFAIDPLISLQCGVVAEIPCFVLDSLFHCSAAQQLLSFCLGPTVCT